MKGKERKETETRIKGGRDQRRDEEGDTVGGGKGKEKGGSVERKGSEEDK